eukprot:scaffold177066_cov32-Tisochrysis_lutea.AAC.2
MRGHRIGELHLTQVLCALIARVKLAFGPLNRIVLVRPHLVPYGIDIGEGARAQLVQPCEVVIKLEAAHFVSRIEFMREIGAGAPGGMSSPPLWRQEFLPREGDGMCMRDRAIGDDSVGERPS